MTSDYTAVPASEARQGDEVFIEGFWYPIESTVQDAIMVVVPDKLPTFGDFAPTFRRPTADYVSPYERPDHGYEPSLTREGRCRWCGEAAEDHR
jgi:hypothetical protein